MINTYLKSNDEAAFREFCRFFSHVIGPIQGQAATGEDPAKGDPAFWYACIRGPIPVPEVSPIQHCSEDEGKAVCGVWA